MSYFYNNWLDELYHHGIVGMKWGVRRYQNEDGSLTALGRRRLGYEELDKAGTAKTNWGSMRQIRKAATKRITAVNIENIKGANSIRKKAHEALGYTGMASNAKAAADVYSEGSKIAEKAGKTKLAIKAQAIANNDKAQSRFAEDVANTKNILDRLSEIKDFDEMTMYTKAGREVVLKDENFKNAMTLGLYSTIKDAQYKLQYSEEERLAKLREND